MFLYYRHYTRMRLLFYQPPTIKKSKSYQSRAHGSFIINCLASSYNLDFNIYIYWVKVASDNTVVRHPNLAFDVR